MNQTVRTSAYAAFSLAVLVLTTCIVSSASIPSGWRLLGSRPAEYETRVDPSAAYDNHASVMLRGRPDSVGFGALTQNVRGDAYRGKRVRFSGTVRAESVKERAALWMEVEKSGLMISYDNMENRPIKGTKDWQRYDVVLDVPDDATSIAFGILLSESGAVWLNRPVLEVVGNETPTTIESLSADYKGVGCVQTLLCTKHGPAKAPRNLNFTN